MHLKTARFPNFISLSVFCSYTGHQNKEYKLDCRVLQSIEHVASGSEDGFVYVYRWVFQTKMISNWEKNFWNTASSLKIIFFYWILLFCHYFLNSNFWIFQPSRLNDRCKTGTSVESHPFSDSSPEKRTINDGGWTNDLLVGRRWRYRSSRGIINHIYYIFLITENLFLSIIKSLYVFSESFKKPKKRKQV